MDDEEEIDVEDPEKDVLLTRRLGEAICGAAKTYLRAIDLIKRRVTLVDRLCDAHLEYSSYGEDLKMMMTRMQLYSENSPTEPKYQQTLFHRYEIPTLRLEYQVGLNDAQLELQEQLS